MLIPERITARWISSLSDEELQHAEHSLHQRFAKEESAEKVLRGCHYNVLRGPESLTNAWLRWSIVCNATRDRGLRTSYFR